MDTPQNLSPQGATRAVIYARISEDRDGEAVGVARQVADCQALAQRRGYNVVDVVKENDTSASDISGKARAKYVAMLDGVRAGKYDVILTYSRSRLIRDLNDFVDLKILWKQTGLHIESVVSGDVDLSTADGELMATMMTAVDVAEARRVQERINRANRERVEVQGEPTNGAKYGWRRGVGNRLELDPDEAAVVAEVARRVVAGESLNRIKNDLNARAVPTARVAEVARKALAGTVKEPTTKPGRTPRVPWDVVKEIADRTTAGEPLAGIVADMRDRRTKVPLWSHASLSSVVRRPGNVARIEYQGQTWPGKFPPILDEETYEKVLLILGDESRTPRRPDNMRHREIRHFLSGVTVCGKPSENGTFVLGDGTRVCGGKMRVRTDTPSRRAKTPERQYAKDTTYQSYSCSVCNGTSCRTYQAEAAVQALVMARLKAPDAPEMFSGDPAEVAAQQARIDGLTERLRRLSLVYSDLGLSDEEYKAQRADLNAQRDEARERRRLAGPSPELARWFDGEPEATWGEADPGQQRDLVAALMTVVILPGGRGRREFDPERRLRIEWKV